MALSSKSQCDLTDCPMCHFVCVSPTILPCGHLICRKCLRGLLEDTNATPQTCPFCAEEIPRIQGQTVSQTADQFVNDLILQEQVYKHMENQGATLCVACEETVAIKICLDCGELYCGNCSKSHQNMRATRDHRQEDLPTKCQICYRLKIPTATTKHRSPTSAARLEQNIGSLKSEAKLFEEELARMQEAESAIYTNIVLMQELKRRLDKQQQLLTTYIPYLSKPEEGLLHFANSFLPRLRQIREDCRSLADKVCRMQKATAESTAECEPAPAVVPGMPEPKSKTAKSKSKKGVPVTNLTRTLTFKPCAEDETVKDGPWISCIVCTAYGRLVFVDKNKMIKVCDLNQPAKTIQSITTDEHPRRVAILPDGGKAVFTTDGKRIYFIQIQGTPTIVSHVHTRRQYWGLDVQSGSDTLVLSCRADTDGPASIDIVTYHGVLVKTILDGCMRSDLVDPTYVCVRGSMAWVSDWTTNTVLKVNLIKKSVVSVLNHPQMKYPCQVSLDNAENCYIASRKGDCVLVGTPTGTWRQVLTGLEHGDPPRVCPWGMCVTNTGLAVAWDEGNSEGYSVIAVYRWL